MHFREGTMTIFRRFFLLVLFLFLAGCGDEDDPTRNNDFVPLTGITVTSGRAQIPAGFSNQFTATGDFSGTFTRPVTTEVTWSSSDPAILTFDNPNSGLGRSVASSPVPVTVMATRAGVTGTLDFTVSNATLTAITVTPAPVSVPKGLSQQFTATGTFSDASSLVITPDVAWTSSSTAVATVDASGLATAVDVGAASISADFPKGTTPTITGSAQMTVTDPSVLSVTLEPATAVLTTTNTRQFTATARFSDNTTQNVTTSATWTSSDPTVATIGANTGLATAVALGTTNITAAFSGRTSAPATLTVATLTSIAVSSPDGTTISLSDPVPTLQLTATGTFTGVAGSQDVTDQVDWTSTNVSVATVGSRTGLVQGINNGSATIQATKDGRIGSITITVQQ
jgi:uncharacterized protein YjdB